jgi:general secretion pathway protein M
MNLTFKDILDRAHPVHKLFTREHVVPLAGYLALLMGLLIVIWLALAGLASDYSEYAAATDVLDQLEGRKPASGLAYGAGKSGSPFLEGRTVTIAGAALQQRVDAAVNEAGGNVLSSQVDLQGSETRQGYVRLSANLEIDQSNLQQLLYELETGMPFLFIDQLVVQVPQAAGGRFDTGSETPRMRVQIDVSGQWQVSK